jgi:hypothetical protein
MDYRKIDDYFKDIVGATLRGRPWIGLLKYPGISSKIIP